MNNSEKPTRGLFFAVMLMGALVLVTVVGYFLWLPNFAPKLITLAVLPFDGNEDAPEYLLHEFPRFVSVRLAESRDLNVIDFQTSIKSFEDTGGNVQNAAIEVGATHILDGDFSSAVGSSDLTLDIRLIDVSKVTPKMKWESSFSTTESTILEMQEQTVASVREKLYDNSPLAALEADFDNDKFEQLLRAHSLVTDGQINDAMYLLLGDGSKWESAPSSYLLAQILPNSRVQYINRAIKLNPNHYLSLIEVNEVQYEQNRDFVQYLTNLTELASKYPNTQAVARLAQVYHDLGWFKEEQELLYRMDRIHPLSSEVALRFAFSRFRTDDPDSVLDALQIAERRKRSNARVSRYRDLFRRNVLDEMIQEQEQGYLHFIANTPIFNSIADIPPTFKNSLNCDEIVELALYLEDFKIAIEKLNCGHRLWLQPPPFWAEDNSVWVAFVNDERYTQWRQSMGLDRQKLADLSPPVVRRLFLPKRKYLWSRQSDSE